MTKKDLAPTSRYEARFRMRIRAGDTIAIGPGKIDLLEAIGTYGSLSAAARSMGMSYRRAWLLLDEINRALEQPATDATTGGQAGGGSKLTAVGERIVMLYREIEREAERASRRQMTALIDLLKVPAPIDSPTAVVDTPTPPVDGST